MSDRTPYLSCIVVTVTLLTSIAFSREPKKEISVMDCIQRSLGDPVSVGESKIYVLNDKLDTGEDIADLQITRLGRLVFVIEAEAAPLPVGQQGTWVSIFCSEDGALIPVSGTCDEAPRYFWADDFYWKGNRYKRVGEKRKMVLTTDSLFAICEKPLGEIRGREQISGLWFGQGKECSWDGDRLGPCVYTDRIIDFGNVAFIVSRDQGSWIAWDVFLYLATPGGLVSAGYKNLQTGWQERNPGVLDCGMGCVVNVADFLADKDEITKRCITSCGDPFRSMVRIEPLWGDEVCELGGNPDLLTRMMLYP